VLTVITGGVGSGKTLLATIVCARAGCEVHANYDLKLPNAHPLDLERLLRGGYDGCIVVLDEAYAYLESRLSGRPLNRALSYILFQSRKMGLHIIMTAQMLMSVDVRFRTLLDVWVHCIQSRAGFEYYFYQTSSGRGRRLVLPWRAAERFFELYDTFEVVELSPGEILKRADELLPRAWAWLREEGLPVTVDTSELACRAVDAPRQVWRTIYLKMKAKEKKEKEKSFLQLAVPDFPGVRRVYEHPHPEIPDGDRGRRGRHGGAHELDRPVRELHLHHETVFHPSPPSGGVHDALRGLLDVVQLVRGGAAPVGNDVVVLQPTRGGRLPAHDVYHHGRWCRPDRHVAHRPLVGVGVARV